MPAYNNNMDDDKLEFLARVAALYYEDGLTQNEISAELEYSRSAISRFLTEARTLGVVEIRINHPFVRNHEVEEELKEQFGIRQVVVLVRGAVSYPKMLKRLGGLAARMLEEVTTDDMVLGVSWGTAVHAVASSLRPAYRPDVTVVQLIGSLGTPDPQIDGPELAQYFARLYNGRYRTMPAPLFVGSKELRDALMNEARMQQVVKEARRAAVAIVGIGGINPEISSLVRAGHLSRDQLADIEEAGAVGDVCAIHVAADGRVLDIPIMRRTINVGVDTLRNIPLVIGVAGGELKAPAIRGALRSKIVNAIVTDDVTAARVIELEKQAIST